MTLKGFWPLLLFLVVCGIGFAYFEASDETIRDNRALLTAVVISLSLAGLLQLALTRQWTMAGLGLFGMVAGVDLFFVSFAPSVYAWESITVPPWLSSAYRSAFIVSGVLLAIAMIRLAWQAYRDRNIDTGDWEAWSTKGGGGHERGEIIPSSFDG